MIDAETVTPPEPRPEDTTRESYAFVMNVLRLADIDRYELAPGHVLRRALPDENSIIRSTMAQMSLGWNPIIETLWEHRWPHPGGTFERLPEEEWRYFVITFKGYNDTVLRLQAAMDLAPLELELAFTILRWGVTPPYHATSSNPGRLFHVLEDAQRDQAFFKPVAVADLAAVSTIYTGLLRNDQRLIDVERLARQVGELKALPHQSPLRFLGYFAILESLLTHVPKPTDPYDSITRQVKKKIALLQNRWPERLDYSAFGNATSDTVWSKMYAYRSLLAHGGAPTFTGELTLLGTAERALGLVKDTVKSIIRQALVEPQLLIDLREC